MRGRTLAPIIVLAALLGLAGLAASYASRELGSAQRLADHAVEVVRAPEIRDVLATDVTNRLIGDLPALEQARPRVARAVERALASEQAASQLRRSVVRADRQLRRGDAATVRLDGIGPTVAREARAISPLLAPMIPAGLGIDLVTLGANDPIARTLRAEQRVRDGALILLAAAGLLLAFAVLLARERGRALLIAGFAIVIVAGLAVLAMLGARSQVVSRTTASGVFGEADAGAAAGRAWDVFAGGFETWLLIAIAAGAALCVLVVLLGIAPSRRAAR